MSRVIYMFERVNKGGIVLLIYDLVVVKVVYNKDLDLLIDRIIGIINKKIIILNFIINGLKEVKIGYEWEGKNMELIKESELIIFMKN